MKSIQKSKKVKVISIFIIFVVITVITSIIATSSGKTMKVKDKLELGDKYLSELKYEEAVVVFEEVIAIEPRCMEAYLGLADAYIGLEQPDKAIESLERGIAVVKQTKADEQVLLEKCDELYIKIVGILTDLGKIKNAIEKLDEGYEVTASNIIQEKNEEYRPTVETVLKEGVYNEKKTVELNGSGVNIYYTTDGSEPTKESNHYEEPIPIEEGTTNIKAVADSKYGSLGIVKSFEYTLKLPKSLLSEENSKAKAAYHTFMKNNDYEAYLPVEDVELEIGWDNNSYFSILDIDQDGTDELLVSYETEFSNIAIFCYADKKVNKVGEIYRYASLYYNKSDKVITYPFTKFNHGDGTYAMVRLEEDSITDVGNFGYIGIERDENGDLIYEYRFSKEEVISATEKETTVGGMTKNEYDNYCDKYAGDGTEVDFIKNTTNNRDLYLLGKKTIELDSGKTSLVSLNNTQFAIKTIWQSSDESIVTVDKDGKLAAKKKGSATITATVEYSKNIQKYSFNVIVKVKSVSELAISEYKKFLIDKEKEWIKSGNYGTPQFRLLDINQDGVKELIYTDWTTNYYTFTNEKMLEIGSLFEGIQYYNSSEKYIIHMVSDGDAYYSIYKMKNNKFEQVTSIIFYCMSNDGGYNANGPYKKDGKKISKAEAEKYITKKHAPGEVYDNIADKYDNTSEMRRKYLK